MLVLGRKKFQHQRLIAIKPLAKTVNFEGDEYEFVYE